ncbi:MAG: hypothetical protein RIK87_06290 [Fuerstiella sp.]
MARKQHRRPPAGAEHAAEKGFSPAKILVIGGSVVLVGILAMLAIRIGQVRSSESVAQGTPETSPSVPAVETDGAGTVIPSPDPGQAEAPVAVSPEPADGGGGVTESSDTVTAPPPPSGNDAVADEVDTDRGRRAMAKMLDVAIDVSDFPQDLRGVIRSTIATGVKAELERSRLTFRAGNVAPVMIVDLDVREQGGEKKLWMSAELRGKDGPDLIKVWERQGNVAGISDQALSTGILPPNLERDISTFFKTLRGDFVDARRQFGS